jgi:hypothetical protein
MAVSHKHGNEPTLSIKGETVSGKLGHYQLLKNTPPYTVNSET